MNEKALEKLLDAVEVLTRYPSIVDEPGQPQSCLRCGVEAPLGDEYEFLEDENNHEENCPWRNLKAAYNNLDNEGYA